MASRMLQLKKADVCVVCGGVVAVGTLAWWDAAEGTVTCKPCHEKIAVAASAQPLVDHGHAGGVLAGSMSGVSTVVK